MQTAKCTDTETATIRFNTTLNNEGLYLLIFLFLSKSLNFFQLVPQMLQAAGQLLMLTSLITYCLFVLFNTHNPVDFPPVRVG